MRLVLVALLTATGSGSPQGFISGKEHFEQARILQSNAKFEEAIVAGLKGLAVEPYSLEAYGILLDTALSNRNDQDALRWGKWLYWAHLYGGRDKEAKAVAERIGATYENWNMDEEIVAEWRDSVEKAARDAGGSSKHYRVAGHLLNKLISLSPNDDGLAKQRDKLFKKAGAAALGGAFSADRARQMSPEWIARQNKAHEDWREAFKRKTKQYKIITNISYEFAETVSVVMDEMYEFYQKTFNYKKKAPEVTLVLMKNRADFSKYCIEKLGFFSAPRGEYFFLEDRMTVAAYDTSQGGDLSRLYTALFHEASHQFMYLLTKKKTKQEPPPWLDEGTACYFEGCELKSDASIVKDRPALGRLFQWEAVDGDEDDRLSLAEVIRCSLGDYDREHFAYGWALVFFLNNYEDEEGTLVYRDAYLEYLDTYKKKGSKDDEKRQAEAFARANKLFVENIDDPEVRNWADFEERWREFMKDLVTQVRSGAKFADALQERSRRHLALENYERALTFAEQAALKRPEDKVTMRLLGLANFGMGREHDSVYWFVLLWEAAFAEADEEAMAAAETLMAEHGGERVAEDYCRATRLLVDQTVEAMQAATEAGHPSAAMLFATHALRATGLHHQGLLDAIGDRRTDLFQDMRLWQAAYNKGKDSNRQWDGIDVVRYDRDGVLINNPEEFARPREFSEVPTLAWLRPPFDAAGKVQVDGENGAYVYLGIGHDGRAGAALNFLPEGRVDLESVDFAYDAEDGEYSMRHVILAQLQLEPAAEFDFVLEVGATGGELRVGKEKKITLPDEWDAERLSGRIALSAGDEAVALFSGFQVRPNEPFWPVPPANQD